MWNTFKNWYNLEDVKYLYRINKISLEEANYTMNRRILIILGYITVLLIGTFYLLP